MINQMRQNTRGALYNFNYFNLGFRYTPARQHLVQTAIADDHIELSFPSTSKACFDFTQMFWAILRLLSVLFSNNVHTNTQIISWVLHRVSILGFDALVYSIESLCLDFHIFIEN